MIAEHVHWIGYVEGENKKEVFADASAFVLPSYSENFGIAVAEALAAGLPCLVSRRVALSEEVERAGAGIVVDTTPQDIAAGLERLMRDRVGLLKKSFAARTLAAKEFSLDRMGARLEALYRRILDSKRGGKIAVAS
jgi:glycosyltransferase involved in cell wall biosynthesis